jgi:hypothetical protein
MQKIRQAKSEAEFRQYCDNQPHAGVANIGTDYECIHEGGCPTLKGENHVENQGASKYTKWLGRVQDLKAKWPDAYICKRCLDKGK